MAALDFPTGASTGDVIKLNNQYYRLTDKPSWAAVKGQVQNVSANYSAMDDATKARMDPRQKGLMDVLVATYATVQTRFEVQYETEGLELILKMLNRQQEIANIIKKLD